jgi:ligand-binding sensor domain-containing protein/serine phosphatase RsbU (regulator of sigma subunit)
VLQKRAVIFLAFTILLQTNLLPQKYFFKRYSVEEGLSQSSVYCLIQDSRGYIWMGTDGGGVSRFDGQKFETFNKTSGLSGNTVRSMLEDSKGNIWIGTDNGLTLYDGYKFITVGAKEGLSGNSIMKIIEGKNGIIWISVWSKGLARLSYGDSISIINYSADDGLLSNFIYSMYEDSGRKLWLGMVGGLSIVEFKDDSTRTIKSVERSYLESESVLSIGSDIKGTVWIGTDGHGLFTAKLSPDNKSCSLEPSVVNNIIPNMLVWDIFSKRNNELWLATDKNGIIKLQDGKITGILNKENGLLTNQILRIIEDREGNMWFASLDEGVLMYKDEKFIGYSENNGIIGSQVQAVLFADNNIFYVATEEGLSKFKKEGNSIKKLNYYSNKNGLNDISVNAIEKSENKVWIGTNNGINILDKDRLSQFSLNNRLDNKKITCLFYDSYKNMWIGTSGGVGRFSDDKFIFLSQDQKFINNEISTIIEDKKGTVWIGTLGGIVRFEGESLNRSDSIKFNNFGSEAGLSVLKVTSLAEDPLGNIWIGTIGGGIFKFDIAKDTIPVSAVSSNDIIMSNTVNSLHFICDTILVAGNDKGFDLLSLDKKQNIKNLIHYDMSDGFLGGENIPNSICADNDGLIWFGTKNGLVRYDPGMDFNYSYLPGTSITGIKLFFEKVDWSAKNTKISRWSNLPENLVLSHKSNHVTFDFTGFCYNNPDELEFSYFLENQSKEWSPYSELREVVFPGLQPGAYTFKVKARNKFGLTGDPSIYHFLIKPPFWQTPWFYIPAFICFIGIIILIIRIRERNLRNEKIKLEKIVFERTLEVVEQKNEIERQRDVVTTQKQEITDSIKSAGRIQQAVLPDELILKNTFSDYFVLLRPKDIVSGDFYWMTEEKNHIIFTAADCTGHGVPGALMSMLGISFLQKIVNETGIINPSAILTSLRENVISALKEEEKLLSSKEGMDIALCSYDKKTRKLWYSGAYNPLYIIRNVKNEFIIIEEKGDRMPIGYHSIMTEFTEHEFRLQKGDTIYLFSDGFIDQFGGENGKKFMVPRFKQMLLDNQQYDMAFQKEVFTNVLEEWINFPTVHSKHCGQIDDILLIGLRI